MKTFRQIINRKDLLKKYLLDVPKENENETKEKKANRTSKVMLKQV